VGFVATQCPEQAASNARSSGQCLYTVSLCTPALSATALTVVRAGPTDSCKPRSGS
jgi:hypothetical protein